VVVVPAQYGSSGITTFLANQTASSSKKFLPANTASIHRSVTKFDPDKSWTAVNNRRIPA
jgi:hypothetical protein